MQNLVFVATFGTLLLAVSIRAFVRLPQRDGQILAAIPVTPCGTAVWNGLNLTGYGLYNAIAYVLAAAITFLLLGSISVPTQIVIVIFFVLVAICMPASSIMARIIEGKRHTLTVGGASFIGILLAPWIVWLTSRLTVHMGGAALPVPAVLAALAIAYTLGEGMGRLACISFGCCYGRPIDSLPQHLQRWLAPIAFRFKGHTRKIAYAGKLENIPVVPIQAMTNILYLITGLIGIFVFLQGYYWAACFSCIFVTQIWRIISEWFRADYRGNLRFSAYQRMSLAGVLYIGILLPILPNVQGAELPQLIAGVQSLWRPGILLALQGLFVFAFLFTGRSSVTGSTITFYVHKDRI